jgi:hypothetical protein
MSQYLEEAAALLRKAAQNNERANSHSGRVVGEGQERIARGFAQLAAIDNGLIPAEMVGDILASVIRAEAPR